MLYALAELEAQGRDNAAMKRYEDRLRDVLAVAPSNLVARLKLVDALARDGQADSAVRQLEEVRRIPPAPPAEASAYLDSTIQFLRAGKAAESRSALDHFLALMEGTAPYQASLDDVRWTDGPIAGRTVLAYSPKNFISLRGVRAKPTVDVAKFVDATNDAGLASPEAITGDVGPPEDRQGPTAVAAGDIDGDGEDDLFVSMWSPVLRKNVVRLYHVQGGVRPRRHHPLQDLSRQSGSLRHLRRLRQRWLARPFRDRRRRSRPPLPQRRQRHVFTTSRPKPGSATSRARARRSSSISITTAISISCSSGMVSEPSIATISTAPSPTQPRPLASRAEQPRATPSSPTSTATVALTSFFANEHGADASSTTAARSASPTPPPRAGSRAVASGTRRRRRLQQRWISRPLRRERERRSTNALAQQGQRHVRARLRARARHCGALRATAGDGGDVRRLRQRRLARSRRRGPSAAAGKLALVLSSATTARASSSTARSLIPGAVRAAGRVRDRGLRRRR